MDYKYERLPIFCHYCGILGHDFKNCTAHYAAEKNGGVEEYQYGEFLRVIGGVQGARPVSLLVLNPVQQRVQAVISCGRLN